MGYPTAGSEGTVVSWGSANFYATLLSRMSPNSAVVSVNGNPLDITALDEEVNQWLPGLNSWKASIRSRWKNNAGAIKLGNVGNVAWSEGGYATHIRGFEITAKTRVHDITEQVGVSSAPVWMAFRPDGLEVTGRVRTLIDSSTALVLPHLPTTALATLTLTYGDEATDDILTIGSTLMAQASASLQVGQLNTYEYDFSGGSITPAGTGSPFGTSALGTPLWGQLATTPGAIVIASLTGSKTLTGADSFYESWTLRADVGGAVELDVEVQGTGALTPA